jgi:polar amino acid transport system permease protein
MTSSTKSRSGVGSARAALAGIDAVPVRHPGRWVAVAVVAVLVAMLLHLLLTNPVFNWPFVFEAMDQNVVIRGFFVGTVLVTVGAMAFGIVGGVLLAVAAAELVRRRRRTPA